MSKNKLCFLFLALLVMSCEKDDICNEGTPGTPRVIIRFYDKDNPTTLKSAPGIKIKGVNQENLYAILESDSLALPMDLSTTYTRYAFILPSSTASLTIADTLQFNYANRRDFYSRRACGYSAEYVLKSPAVTTIGSLTWYVNSTVVLDTIRNEEQAHLAIYH